MALTAGSSKDLTSAMKHAKSFMIGRSTAAGAFMVSVMSAGLDTDEEAKGMMPIPPN